MDIQTIIAFIIQLGLFSAYSILFAIIFAESGLLIGFFLPGDSLLFTAGFLASKGILNIYVLVLVFFVGAVLGDNVGYAFGHKVGKKLFKKKDSLFFHKDNLLKAKLFYKKHGRKTIILARFLPLIRTFAPIVAGIGDMHYPTFVSFNVIGAVLWAIGLPVLGYFLGGFIPNVDRYIVPIIIAIITISLAPSVIHVLKEKEMRNQIGGFIKKIFSG